MFLLHELQIRMIDRYFIDFRSKPIIKTQAREVEPVKMRFLGERLLD